MVLGIGFLSLAFATVDANAQTSDDEPSRPFKCVPIPNTKPPPPLEDVAPASDDGVPQAVAPPTKSPCPAGMVEEEASACGDGGVDCRNLPKGKPPMLSNHE